MKKLLAIAVCLAVFAISLLFWFQRSIPAPDVSFKIIDGSEIRLSNLKGKPVLINFWATTCSTCMEEMPHLFTMYNELHPKGLEMIGVAVQYNPPNEVMAYVENNDIPYSVALDIDGNAAKAFGDVSVTPSSFLIAPNGDIIQRKTGTMDINNLRGKIEDLLSHQLLATSHKPLIATSL